MIGGGRLVTFRVAAGRTPDPLSEHYNNNHLKKLPQLPVLCYKAGGGGFDTLSSPPLADNDVDVAETELKEGE